MALDPYNHYQDVSTSVSEVVPTLRQQLISTLICPICKLIFRSPISTCSLGHSICFACATRFGKCGICASALVAIRNYTIESQLALVEVNCGFPLCTSWVKASNLYDHLGKCEFRAIHCQLPILTTGNLKSKARIDCTAVSPFQDYISHLTHVHGVSRYDLAVADAFYDFRYTATGEDFLGFHQVKSELTTPIPILWGGKSFLLHTHLHQQELTVCISAMFSEEEATGHVVTVQLYRAGLRVGHPTPKWEIRVHNYHMGKKHFETTGLDRVRVLPTILRRYAENHAGKWRWFILCQISKRPLIKLEFPETSLD